MGVSATRMLAVLKSAEQLPMHQSDQIAPVKCDKLGFPFRPANESDCLKGFRFWRATENVTHDPLNLQNQNALDDLVNGGYKNFTHLQNTEMVVEKINPA